MITSRQKKIIKLIVENYYSTATPISSEQLASKLQVSSATIRNDMAELTHEGYLQQPHTSAGRIPCEKGWRFYVENYVSKDKELSAKYHELFQEVLTQSTEDHRQFSKDISKKIVEIADAATIVAFGPRDVYYTGLTNLFSQPEFNQLQAVVQISHVIDHLDEVMVSLFYTVDTLQIVVGEDNLFSPECSLVVTDVDHGEEKYIIGILGPMRMNYVLNCSLLNHTKHLLEQPN